MAWSFCFRALALVLAVLPLQIATEAAPHEGISDEALAWMQEGIDKHVAEEYREGLRPLRETLATRDRTFVAKRDLRKGELLLRLPKDMLIHAGYFCGEDSPFATSLKKGDTLEGAEKTAHLTKFADIEPQIWQALYLLAQRRLGQRSFWHQYIKLLPRKFPGNPVFYTEKDFSLLQGSFFLPVARSRLGKWTETYQTVSEVVEGFANNFSLEEFFWARSAVESRAFGAIVPGHSPEESRRIRLGPSGYENSEFTVPIGDMLNHRHPKQLEWNFNNASRSYDIWVREDVPAGGELFLSYGMRSNDGMLLQYGFAVPDLPKRNLRVTVLVGLDDVPDYEAKRKWLMVASSTTGSEHEVAANLKMAWDKDINAGPSQMLAHARLLELSDMKEVERQISPEMKNCKSIPVPSSRAPRFHVLLCPNPVSIPNEQAALKRCLKVIRKALKAYPTSLKDDKRQLRNLDRFGVAASLVTVVRDEKIVLHWWERFFGLALDALDLGSGHSLEKKCNEVFGEARCSAESNHYMNTTLYELLGGGVSTPNPGFLGSKAPWLILVLVVSAFAKWRKGSVGIGSGAGASPGQTGKKAKRG